MTDVHDEVHEIHTEAKAVFQKDTLTGGLGTVKLLSGLSGQGTLYMTPTQAKALADAIYKQLNV